MWNPVTISMKGLFSHVNSQYTFATNRCTMIFGKNQTDKNLENNGAGKTTLYEAISLALTNDSLRALKKEVFINRDSETCQIYFKLYNPILKMTLEIERKFFRGNKSSQVRVIENGVVNAQIVSVLDANNRIIELIGINKEDLLRYYIISQDNQYTFFTAADSEKKEILNRITSADMLNPVLEKLEADRREKECEYNDLLLDVTKLTSKIETLQEQKQDMISSDDNTEQIKRYEDSIKSFKYTLATDKDTLANLSNKLNSDIKKLATIERFDISALKGERVKMREKVEEVDELISQNKSMKVRIETEISGKIECPKCGEEFIPSSELGITVSTGKNMLVKLDKEISVLSTKRKDLLKKIEEINAKINDAVRKNEAWDDLEVLVKRGKIQVSAKKTDIENAQQTIEKYFNIIERLKNEKKNSEQIKAIDKKIYDISQEIKTLNETVSEVSGALDMLNFWKFNMGKNGFSTYLANKSIKVIEGATNSFLRKFGVDISVLINGFTVLKSGEVREKIDCFVSSNGINAEAFIGKSGGERGRVTLAGILGIQKLINMSTEGKGLNLLCFDECFHGMDSRGQENIIKIFEKMGITILIITQNVLDSFNNENTLKVVKRGNISEYVQSF